MNSGPLVPLLGRESWVLEPLVPGGWGKQGPGGSSGMLRTSGAGGIMLLPKREARTRRDDLETLEEHSTRL